MRSSQRLGKQAAGRVRSATAWRRSFLATVPAYRRCTGTAIHYITDISGAVKPVGMPVAVVESPLGTGQQPGSAHTLHGSAWNCSLHRSQVQTPGSTAYGGLWISSVLAGSGSRGGRLPTFPGLFLARTAAQGAARRLPIYLHMPLPLVRAGSAAQLRARAAHGIPRSGACDDSVVQGSSARGCDALPRRLSLATTAAVSQGPNGDQRVDPVARSARGAQCGCAMSADD